MKHWMIKCSAIALILLTTVVFVARCASTPKLTEKAAGENSPTITKSQAKTRFQQVSNVSYDLNFEIKERETTYSGTSLIEFQLKDKSESLRVDFYSGQVSNVFVNGTNVPFTYNNHFIVIDPQFLADGKNSVKIVFQRDFVRDGSGFHRFQDPEDDRIYTYTDLEPFDANRVFPCFDQPDLKATYKMQVTAPAKWEVITYAREKGITKAADGRKIWAFPESAKFSTYIWSLHAGPYKKWEGKKSKDIPLRLFARRSLAKYVKTTDWFTFTRQGFDFFESYFDYKYPYKKYDQVIVPEFNAGAMENVAAVTFSEHFVSRGKKSEVERRRLANVIMHEMAHMWFGNLVTMKWWNDLWLNESFATYMANVAVAENTEFKDKAWRGFLGTKKWAYLEDQLSTTHPIEAKVPDTLQAFANFDGITYGKGASVLKQIAYYLGPEKFKKGVQVYFKKYAESNATLSDFMHSLSSAAGVDLANWENQWLRTSGINTVTADLSCEYGKVKSLFLRQTGSPIRTHAMEVALLRKQKEVLQVEHSYKTVLGQGPAEVKEAIGDDCPDAVYPNYNDQAYVKVNLDKRSQKTFLSSMSAIEDNFLRQMVWMTFWDMVYDRNLNLLAYAETAIGKNLEKEDDPFILTDLFNTIHGWRNTSPSVLFYYPRSTAESQQGYEKLVAQLEKQVWKRLRQAKSKSEQQKIFFDSFREISETEWALNNLKKLLDGKVRLRGFKVDQDKRWEIISRLATFDHQGKASEIIERELKRDSSDIGNRYAIAARSSLPYWVRKQNWIGHLMDSESPFSYSQLRVVVRNLFPRSQNRFREQYSKDFYRDLTMVNAGRDPSFVRTFTALAPFECEPKTKDSVTSYLKSDNGKDLVAPAHKKLKMQADLNARCRAIRKLALKNLGGKASSTETMAN